MQISDFEIEKKLSVEGFTVIIGTDEVGRGPLAGPVVAAAVQLRNFEFRMSNFETKKEDEFFNDQLWDLVRDSKKLSQKQREKVFDFIHEHFHVGIGLCDHNTIDRINILEASFLAMKKAVQELLRKIPNDKIQIPNKFQISNDQFSNFPKTKNQKLKTIILVDGNKTIPNFSLEQRAIVGGDKLAKSISAASIVAKVTRDRMMKEFAQKYPEYGFEKHMGYGTKFHMDALAQFGPCEIHRKSFGPVKRLGK